LGAAPPNERMELTAPRRGRADDGVVDAAAARSPFGERRRRSSSAVFDGPLVRMSRTLSKAPTVGAILVAAVAAWGMGTGPSLEEYKRTLRSTAGDGARDCGVVALQEARTEALRCSADALAAASAFFVAFQVQGIDSVIYVGLVRPANGEAEKLTWDSDITGRSALLAERRIFREPCTQPAIKKDVAAGRSPISCGGK
jgi:CubicO group peptidase (beta-lactamase class C family)